MPYFTQQLFSGQRDRVLRVVDVESDTQETAGFIHVFDERRVFDFNYASELSDGAITQEDFDKEGEAANTFSVSFMPLAADDTELSADMFEEWAGLIKREYALMPNIHINLYQQALKPEIESIDKPTFEERMLELVSRILGSSAIGFEERSLTMFPSFLVQEQPEMNQSKTPTTQIILPE